MTTKLHIQIPGCLFHVNKTRRIAMAGYCLFTVILLFPSVFCEAKQISKEQSLDIVRKFYSEQRISKAFRVKSTIPVEFKLDYVCKDRPVVLSGRAFAPASADSAVCYYIYSVGADNGFIIVSGDDRAKKILGYSETGSFDINRIPSNFRAWLSFYQGEMKALMAQPETTGTSLSALSLTSESTASESAYAQSVAPLLRGIKWGQDSPYNNLCPFINDTTRAAAGCGATAMAQVMRYFKWPVTGTGSNTYTPKRLTAPLTVDFSQTTYAWDQMAESYGTLNPQVQKDAVSTLMYHAGVAVNMDYGETSYSNLTDMGLALKKYFSYDANVQFFERDYYSSAEWENLVKGELNAQRPLIYRGATLKNDGHLFVCDGYDSNGLYHINWGWSGYSDGYFQLSVLNPGSLSIAGGTSEGYNSGQSVLAGIQKAGASLTNPTYNLNLTKPLTPSANTVERNTPFTISTQMYNRGINTFSGSFGIALYNEGGFVAYIDGYTQTINSFYGYSAFSSPAAAIPSTVANGDYKLYSVYKATGQSDWQIMRGKVGTPNYLNVSITSSSITFATPDVLPKLTLNSLSVTGNLYQNKTGRFNVSITNTGGEYNSLLVLNLESVVDKTVTQVVSRDPVNIPSGQTKSFDLVGAITLVPGQYNLQAMYDPANIRSSATNVYTLGNPLLVSILSEPTEAPVLTLTTRIIFPDSTKVDKNNLVLTAHLKNTGGYYSNDLCAFIFRPTGGYSLTSYGYQSLILDKNEERTITFTGSVSLESGQYITQVRYWDPVNSTWKKFSPTSNGQAAFTLIDVVTGTEAPTSDKQGLYPSIVSDKLYIQSGETIIAIRIMDLSGKQILLMNPESNGRITIPVEKISAGAYFLQTRTATGIKVYKFIKK